MEGHGLDVTFIFQFGLFRDTATYPQASLSLKVLKELARDFIQNKIPDHGINRLEDRILLFKHEYNSNNILQFISSPSDVTDETLIEIVLTGKGPSVIPDIAMIRAHAMSVHSYKIPTFCDFCGEMLFGLVKQGLKCAGCGQNYHKRCYSKVPNNCSYVLMEDKTGKPSRSNNLHVPRSPSGGSNSSAASANSGNTEESGWSRSVDAATFTLGGKAISFERAVPNRILHKFEPHTYGIPTMCQVCKRLLKGVYKQGYQCEGCYWNVHKKCIEKVPKYCTAEKIKDAIGISDYAESTASSDSHSMSNLIEDESDSEKTSSQGSQTNGLSEIEGTVVREEDSDSTPSSSLSLHSANIPLQRIVQSVKHTKRRGSKVIKEGWLVHFTSKDRTVRRHFWRLDTKAVTLFQNERSSNYYREIPLPEIITIETAKFKEGDIMHCFEIKTATIKYFVGQDLLSDSHDQVQLNFPPPETGIGAYLAKSWETSLRQALMPVTTNLKSEETRESEEEVTDMTQLYQICAEDILGSGQFGTVFGGIHKKTSRPVAIKVLVIDKLRFPTKQEAQLKNEVAILQNLSHPGVVNLERMFETPERIFVVMEKLKGDMLDMILSHDKGRLPERVTKFLITQILIALKHLHTKNIAHCDLKPENVLLSSDSDFPQVKLCDFGFARIIGEKSFRRSIVGTPAYLAPEVLLNKCYNRSLDMWSVGVIVYVSLSGTFPFNEDEDINQQIQNAGFMYPPNPWKEISSEAIDLINKLLQVKQNKRLSVDKSLQHIWLQDYQTWCDLRALETQIGVRYLTHESDDVRWETYKANCL